MPTAVRVRVRELRCVRVQNAVCARTKYDATMATRGAGEATGTVVALANVDGS